MYKTYLTGHYYPFAEVEAQRRLMPLDLISCSGGLKLFVACWPFSGAT
jgi:hypothetical protein